MRWHCTFPPCCLRMCLDLVARFLFSIIIFKFMGKQTKITLDLKKKTWNTSPWIVCPFLLKNLTNGKAERPEPGASPPQHALTMKLQVMVFFACSPSCLLYLGVLGHYIAYLEHGIAALALALTVWINAGSCHSLSWAIGISATVQLACMEWTIKVM